LSQPVLAEKTWTIIEGDLEYGCLKASTPVFRRRDVRRESRFQARFIRELRSIFPGCVILKNNPAYLQGVPDILILWGRRWAALECKESEKAFRGLNQIYYVDLMREMSYAAFVFPANKEQVLNDLQRALAPSRAACIPRPK
jgi:hypothetical protein